MSLGEIVFIGWNLLMILATIVYILRVKQTGMFKNVDKSNYDLFDETESLP